MNVILPSFIGQKFQINLINRMEQYEIYTKLQNLLLSMNENGGSNQVMNFILENELLKDKEISFSTMKLLSSFVYSHTKQLNAIVSMLKKIPKIGIYTYIHDIDFDGIGAMYEIIQKIQISYYLLYKSKHITKEKYKQCLKNTNRSCEYLTERRNRINYYKIFNHSEDLCPYYKAIFHDDVDLLQNIIEHTNFDIQKAIKFPIFKLYNFFSSPILLEYSAFYGSIRCFKYLLMKSNDVDYSQLLEYAVAGGNIEIIHITENMSHDLNILKNVKLLYMAITFMHNELIEYIVDNYGVKIDGECYILCINNANYAAMIMLKDLDKARSINEFGEHGFTPLMKAVFEGFFDFFVYLLSIEAVEHTKCCPDYGSILFCAALVGNLNIAEYIIKNKLYIDGESTIWTFGKVYELYMHYKEIELEEKSESNNIWVEFIEEFDDEDEKNYIIKKRYYDAKYKKKKSKRFNS